LEIQKGKKKRPKRHRGKKHGAPFSGKQVEKERRLIIGIQAKKGRDEKKVRVGDSFDAGERRKMQATKKKSGPKFGGSKVGSTRGHIPEKDPYDYPKKG